MRYVLLVLALVVAAITFGCGGGDDEANAGAPDGGTAAAGDASGAGSPETSEDGGNPTGRGDAGEGSDEATPGPTATLPPELLADSVLALDADPTTPAIDATVTRAVGEEFDVVFVMAEAGSFYAGYQMHVGWDDAVVSWVSLEHLKPQGLETCSPTINPQPNEVAGFCVDAQLNPNEYEGPLVTVRFKCEAPGTAAIRLLDPEEGRPGTKVEGRGEGTKVHILQMDDASVTCA